jgi:glyoxylase-like metal-dependent hydrolase (beta-lactamase superfamily II)
MLGWGYQRSVAPVVPVVTEEGQAVVFHRMIWQNRELTKRLPLDEDWPANAQLGKAFARFGLDKGTPPDVIPAPAKLATDIYLVGQDVGNNHTYLIDCGPQGLAVVDPSYESEFDKTIARIEQCGYSRKNIKWVINTHCHLDHAMASKKFQELGAEILIHEDDAAAIEKGTRITGSADKFPPVKVDRRLSDGEELRLGNKLFHVIHTPGHTPGSASFLLDLDGKNVLISGDTVFYDGMLGAQNNPYADNRRYLASLEKLEKFTLGSPKPVRWDVLLPGHGAIPMNQAYRDVQKCRETLAGDLAAGREPVITPHRRPEYRSRMFGRPATKGVL